MASALAWALTGCGGRVQIEPRERDATVLDAQRADARVELDGGPGEASADGAAPTVDAWPDDASRAEDARLDGAPDAGSPSDARPSDAAADAEPDGGEAGLDVCSAHVGELCSDACPDGLVCDQGVCLAPCGSGTGCCPAEGVGCVEGTEPGTSVCTEGCALVDDTRCAAGLGCRFLRQDGTTEVLTFCGGVDDTHREGDPCTRNGECPRGGTCVAAGYCVTYCRVGPGTCGEGRTCLQFVPHARVGAFEYGYCSARCRFVLDEGCVAGTTCLPLIDNRFGESAYYAQCRTVGPGVEGGACATYVECGASQVCLEGACRAMCRMAVTADCPSGRTCRSFAPVLATPDGEVGYCGA